MTHAQLEAGNDLVAGLDRLAEMEEQVFNDKVFAIGHRLNSDILMVGQDAILAEIARQRNELTAKFEAL